MGDSGGARYPDRQLVRLELERSRTDDGQTFVAALGKLTPKQFIWDNAQPHHPKRVQEEAA